MLHHNNKEYFLGNGVSFVIGISRPHEEQKMYYDNEPTITLYSMSDYVMLGVMTDDDNVNRRILLTPKQAREIAKQLKKFARRVKR